MKKYTIVFLLCSVCFGCQQQLRDFVGGATSPTGGGNATFPSTSSNGPQAMKISPGHANSSSANLSMRATMTPTKQMYTSTGMSAQLSLYQTQTSP